MTEVLLEYEEPVRSPQGARYRVRACGREMDRGRWEGWFEFHPIDGGDPVRSPRETVQPKFSDLQYWATGISTIYLEGAIHRCLNALEPPHSIPPRPKPA